MNQEDLSPAAQQQLDELERTAFDGGAWPNDAYRAILRKLAERDTSTVADWEIKGHGGEVLEKSREDHRVAVELKAYAIPMLEFLRLMELDGSPESPPIPLDEFLQKAMPNTGKEVLSERFKRFLIEEAVRLVDEQTALHPCPGISRDERVQQMAAENFALYDEDGMHGPTRNIYGPRFRHWWKRHEGNNLSGKNHADGVTVEQRLTSLIKLLPSKQRFKGISKTQWRDLADAEGLVSSTRTFNRDVNTLLKDKRIHPQEDGSFRQIPK